MQILLQISRKFHLPRKLGGPNTANNNDVFRISYLGDIYIYIFYIDIIDIYLVSLNIDSKAQSHHKMEHVFLYMLIK